MGSSGSDEILGPHAGPVQVKHALQRRIRTASRDLLLLCMG